MIKKRKISNFVKVEQKSFANYTISNRGICNAADMLINSERMLLQSAPKQFNKSLKLIGDVISSGYHHGDLSLSKTLNKLAQEFKSSSPLLTGDGFFGSITTNRPAATRYTSVKINSEISDDISKYKHLQKPDKPLPVDYPIGLLKPVIGIATGFAAIILPRKKDDIIKYLQGKLKRVKPHFSGYTGEITYNKDENNWLFQPVYKLDKNLKNTTIVFEQICPMWNFDRFLQKLDKTTKEIDTKIRVKNLSTKEVNIEVIIPNDIYNDDMIEQIVSVANLYIRENITMVYDRIIEYEKIEDYLEDFKLNNEHLILDDMKWRREHTGLKMVKAQVIVQFLKFMLEGKKTQKEVDDKIEILSKNLVTWDKRNYDDISPKIAEVLNNYLARNITKEKLEHYKKEALRLHDEVWELNTKIQNYKTTRPTVDYISTKITNYIEDDLSDLSDIIDDEEDENEEQ